MLPEHAFPGRRVRLTKSPYPELHDGHVARRSACDQQRGRQPVHGRARNASQQQVRHA